MKRTIEINQTEENEPHSKVVLVEREANPLGISLVNPTSVAKRSYVDAMELDESLSNVDSSIQSNARNKLEVIGRQMKNLESLMNNVFEEAKLNTELHSVACNFVKKPGHVYHLYKKPSGQQYFGMLSPEEWQNTPHQYVGSYRLEADQSWTPANQSNGRYEGLNYLSQSFGITQMQSLC